MADEPGDKQYDEVLTRENDSGSRIEEGAFVVPTGDDTVAPADANGAGGGLHAVAVDPIEPGETGAVALGGARPVLVASDVVANDELAVPDSSSGGTPGVALPGGSSGLKALEDAYDDGNGVYRALVKLD